MMVSGSSAFLNGSAAVNWAQKDSSPTSAAAAPLAIPAPPTTHVASSNGLIRHCMNRVLILGLGAMTDAHSCRSCSVA